MPTFDVTGGWVAVVPAVPKGDRSLDWYDVAVPALASQVLEEPPAPCCVVVRVTSPTEVGIRGIAKRLLDALHDRRRTGPTYASLGCVAPLADDHPRHVVGLAVETAYGPDQVTYRLGAEMIVAGEQIAEIGVDVDCPNDVAASSGEGTRLLERRKAFGLQVAAAWNTASPTEPSGPLAVVVRHPLGRDEDNTWEGWTGAIAGASWNEGAWRGHAPVRSSALRAIGSVVDTSIHVGVRYQLLKIMSDSGTAMMAPAVPGLRAAGNRSKKTAPVAQRKEATPVADSDWRELRTIQEFRGARAAADRIVITDSSNRHPTVHDPSCHTLSEERFFTKVIKNAGRNGRYYAVANTRLAEAGGAMRCGSCHR